MTYKAIVGSAADSLERFLVTIGAVVLHYLCISLWSARLLLYSSVCTSSYHDLGQDMHDALKAKRTYLRCLLAS